MTYANFEKDIKTCFSKFIDKYDLDMIEDPQNQGWYVLQNAHCKLYFSFDRGEIDCVVKSRQIDYVDVKKLYSLENSNSVLPKYDNPWSPINQLNRILYIIENSNLKKVLIGDHSWL